MRQFKSLALAGAGAFVLAFAASCGQPQPAPETTISPTVEATAEPAVAAQPATVVAAAVGDARLSTLVAALQNAGLVTTLEGAGPFTVFAPTNDAFAAIDAQVQPLLANTDKTALTNVLTYHVVPGRIMAADLAGQMATPATVQGGTLAIGTGPSGPTIGGANVVAADIVVGNGVVHIIDRVLLPPAR
jgi:uncharacterized surface protein with fasciclin (FAS1) repeats